MISEHKGGAPEIITEVIQVTHTSAVTAGSNIGRYTAPTKSGYTFWMWGSPWTASWIGTVYAGDPFAQEADFWCANVAWQPSYTFYTNLIAFYRKN